MRIKRTIKIILVFVLLLIIWLSIRPRIITPTGYFDNKYLEYEKRYSDISTFTSKCDYVDIKLVAYYYKRKEKYSKCQEWIIESNKCVSLQPDYKKEFLLNSSKECNKR